MTSAVAAWNPAGRTGTPRTAAATATPTQRQPHRPRNAFVREDRIQPHLPACALRLTATLGPPPPNATQIPHLLRTAGITLSYDLHYKTLTADAPTRERIFIG
ncbi:hypothetical protein [Streptomyces sp. NPDC047009]|uniref:hypothetical protein n=1 Tax=Streptomyces sp. NPDC047009 TaxID=3154496 RepID=UPI0033E3ACDF